MSETDLVVAVVPARGGSKRIPRKNIRLFHGVPLIARTVAILRQSSLFDKIVVSTDDDEIAEIAAAAGAEAPFRRPARLADDFTPTVPVVIDAITRIEAASSRPVGAVCVAYPTAVFMRPYDLSQAFELLDERSVDVVFSATTYPAPIMRSWRELPDGSAEMIWPEYSDTRSQDLETAYHDAGQFYWWAPGTWKRYSQPTPVRSAMFLLPRWRVHDIDDEDDWIAAETTFTVLQSRSG